MTVRQRAFNVAWQRFAIERRDRSVNNRGQCRYRGENGARCVVGWLIDDEHYDPSIEGCWAHSPFVMDRIRDSGFGFDPKKDSSWLSKFQSCHDGALDTDGVVERLRALADKYGLAIPGEA